MMAHSWRVVPRHYTKGVGRMVAHSRGMVTHSRGMVARSRGMVAAIGRRRD
jgi:hypothetical protein